MLHNLSCIIGSTAKKRRFFAWLLTLIAILIGCTACEKAPKMLEANIFAMDTFMSLKVCTEDEALIEVLTEELERLEKLFSVTLTDSDISKINSELSAHVENDTLKLIKAAKKYGEATDGAIDISIYPVVSLWGFTNGNYHVPSQSEIDAALKFVDFNKIEINGDLIQIDEGMKLDLGSIAKGYASEKLCEMLRENGITSAILNLGGNIQVIGTKPDGSNWKIGIKNPFETDESLLTVEISDCAVITSGNYERYFEYDGKKYCHIFDTASGYPIDNDLASVTVIGKNGIECDALSTALLSMGTENAIEFWKSCEGVELILVTKDQKIIATENISSHCTNYSTFPIEVVFGD